MFAWIWRLLVAMEAPIVGPVRPPEYRKLWHHRNFFVAIVLIIGFAIAATGWTLRSRRMIHDKAAA